jgi:hypothetical protein
MTKGEDPIRDSDLTRSVWNDIVGLAERFYQPGVFTTLHGFEWSPAPNGNNLHCGIIFCDGEARVKDLVPFSSYDSKDPEDLWAWMDAYQKHTGGRVFAIPHNSNLSNGLMFDDVTFGGEPLSHDYAERRGRSGANAATHEGADARLDAGGHGQATAQDASTGHPPLHAPNGGLSERGVDERALAIFTGTINVPGKPCKSTKEHTVWRQRAGKRPWSRPMATITGTRSWIHYARPSCVGKVGQADNAEVDCVLDTAYRQKCALESLLGQRADRAAAIIEVTDREWFLSWIEEHRPQSGAKDPEAKQEYRVRTGRQGNLACCPARSVPAVRLGAGQLLPASYKPESSHL